MLFFPVCPVPVQKASVSELSADNLAFINGKICAGEKKGETSAGDSSRLRLCFWVCCGVSFCNKTSVRKDANCKNRLWSNLVSSNLIQFT